MSDTESRTTNGTYGIDVEKRIEVPLQGTDIWHEHTQAVGLGYDEEGPFRANGEHT